MHFIAILNLELHHVRLVSPVQTELSIQISTEHGSGINGLEHGSVDLLLVGLALVRDDGGLGRVAGEELRLSLAGGRVGAGEVIVVDGRNIDLRDIDLSGGGNDVRLVDPAERDTVDLVGAGDEEET